MRVDKTKTLILRLAFVVAAACLASSPPALATPTSCKAIQGALSGENTVLERVRAAEAAIKADGECGYVLAAFIRENFENIPDAASKVDAALTASFDWLEPESRAYRDFLREAIVSAHHPKLSLTAWRKRLRELSREFRNRGTQKEIADVHTKTIELFDDFTANPFADVPCTIHQDFFPDVKKAIARSCQARDQARTRCMRLSILQASAPLDDRALALRACDEQLRSLERGFSKASASAGYKALSEIRDRFKRQVEREQLEQRRRLQIALAARQKLERERLERARQERVRQAELERQRRERERELARQREIRATTSHWRITNGTRRTISFQLYHRRGSKTRRTYPRPGRVITVAPGETGSLSIKCRKRAKICYGAWWRGRSRRTTWGCGDNCARGCKACCWDCGSDPSRRLVKR